jgi:hypothetical protein
MINFAPGRATYVHAATVLALVLVPVLSACEDDYRPRAIGKEGEVTVVMDSSHWTGSVGDALRGNVTPWVETLPVSERYFQIRHLELTSERTYESIQDLKNVVVVAPLSDSTNEASFLRRRLSDQAREAIEGGQVAVVDKPNLWRRSQRVYFVTAATPDALADALQEQGSTIRSTFQEVTLQRMKKEMYDTDRQYAVEDSLMARHGFALNVQNTFQVAVDTTTASGGVVWLRRLLAKTRREFLVYYLDDASPSRLTPEWVHATQDSLTRKYMQGNVAGFVRTDYRRPLDTEQISFLDRYGYKVEGLWRMVVPTGDDEFRSAGSGGPFVTYAFYDQAQDRIYLLTGSVFAPGFDKLQFVRQMEVMARTFRTRAEVQKQQVTASASE